MLKGVSLHDQKLEEEPLKSSEAQKGSFWRLTLYIDSSPIVSKLSFSSLLSGLSKAPLCFSQAI